MNKLGHNSAIYSSQNHVFCFIPTFLFLLIFIHSFIEVNSTNVYIILNMQAAGRDKKNKPDTVN